MKRRNFIGGLLAAPFVVKALANEAAIPVAPVELHCLSNCDCPQGCHCDPGGGKCVPASGYIEFEVPMEKMNWKAQVTGDGHYYNLRTGKYMHIKRNPGFYNKSERNMLKYIQRTGQK